MVETKAKKSVKFIHGKIIRVKWTEPIPEFNVEKEFSKNDGPVVISLSKGVERNFTSFEFEKDTPGGDIYRYDFNQADNMEKVLRSLLKKKQRRTFITPLVHIRNILLDQYYEPDGRCGLRDGGKSLFLAFNCYGLVLPIWSVQVGTKFYLDTVTEDFQDSPISSNQKTYIEKEIIKHNDTLFYFSGPEES